VRGKKIIPKKELVSTDSINNMYSSEEDFIPTKSKRYQLRYAKKKGIAMQDRVTRV
jgi:hypothetical protein